MGVQGMPATLLLLFISNFISGCQQEGSPHCPLFVSISMPAALRSSHSHHNTRGSPSFPPFMSVSTPAGGDFPSFTLFPPHPPCSRPFRCHRKGIPPSLRRFKHNSRGSPSSPCSRPFRHQKTGIPCPLVHAPSTSFVSISNASRRGIPSFVSVLTPEDGESPPCPLVHAPSPSFASVSDASRRGIPSLPLVFVRFNFDTRRRGSPLVHAILTTPTVGDPPSPSFASISTPEEGIPLFCYYYY